MTQLPIVNINGINNVFLIPWAYGILSLHSKT